MNYNLNEHLSILPCGLYNTLHKAPLQQRHNNLLKLYCFMSLYFMSHSAMTQAVKTLTDEIQQFLLDIGQEEYTITILNGVK
jgi:hypothetical protein